MTDEPDALKTTVDLVSGSWNSANTDSVTPTIQIVTEAPHKICLAGNQDYILIYHVAHTVAPNDFGSSYNEKTTDRVSVDLRTMNSRDHLRKMYQETRRIVNANRLNPDTGAFHELRAGPFVDFSDRSKGFYRYVYDVFLNSWVVAK